MNPGRRRKVARGVGIALLGLVILCSLAAAVSAWSNRGLPTAPQVADRLSETDQAMIAEVMHLKRELGGAIWPEWARMDIPFLVFNDAYAFLFAHPDPPPAWAAVTDEQGQDVYALLSLHEFDEPPQNFAERVGPRWAGSIATTGLARRYLIEGLQDVMPQAIESIFPFRLAIRFMLPSEQLIAATLHESFHAYQAEAAPDRFAEAEGVYAYEGQYWDADTGMHDDWREEVDWLIQAVEATTDREAAEFARSFIRQRQQRRANHELPTTLIDYERQLEWLEGLAMYVEFSSWRTASEAQDYEPVPAMREDPDFREYSTFEAHWARQLEEMRRQADEESDIRFYFTGMAQAVLLDRLSPGWKTQIMADDAWIESLLAEAAGQGE